MEERGGWRRGEKKHSHLRGSKAFNHLTSEASQCPARAASPRPPAPPLQSRKSKQSREVCRGHLSIDTAVLMLFHCSRRTLRVIWLRIPVNVSFICFIISFPERLKGDILRRQQLQRIPKILKWRQCRGKMKILRLWSILPKTCGSFL